MLLLLLPRASAAAACANLKPAWMDVLLLMAANRTSGGAGALLEDAVGVGLIVPVDEVLGAPVSLRLLRPASAASLEASSPVDGCVACVPDALLSAAGPVPVSAAVLVLAAAVVSAVAALGVGVTEALGAVLCQGCASLLLPLGTVPLLSPFC